MYDMANEWHCTVEELGQRLSSRELTYWLAYWELKAEERKNEGKLPPTRANMAAAVGVPVKKVKAPADAVSREATVRKHAL